MIQRPKRTKYYQKKRFSTNIQIFCDSVKNSQSPSGSASSDCGKAESQKMGAPNQAIEKRVTQNENFEEQDV